MSYHDVEGSRVVRRLDRRFLLAIGIAAAVALAWVGVAEAGNCGFRCYTKAWQAGASLAGVQARWDIQELGATD